MTFNVMKRSYCFLGVTLILTLTQFRGDCLGAMISTVYTKSDHSRVSMATEFPLCGEGHCPGGRQACVMACASQGHGCTGVNFRGSDGYCAGVSSSYFDFHSDTLDNPVWENFSPQKYVRDGEWILVFRAQEGVDASVADARLMNSWHNASLVSDPDLDILDRACYSPRASTCTQFFRSHLMNSWPSDQIDQVRLSLYKDGQDVVTLTFNGQGSTKDDWFNTSRLLTSPWNDLNPNDPNFISIAGQATRRFVVVETASEYCPPGLVGWLLVLGEAGNLCSFERDLSGFYRDGPNMPKFIYSPQDTKVNFDTPGSFAQAEVMAIFIKML